MLPHIIDLQLDNWLDEERMREIVMTIQLLMEMGHPGTENVSGEVPINCPVIFSCPDQLVVGNSYTIIGYRFGNQEGALRIESDRADRPFRIDPKILAWSDTAIQFEIPATTGKIPYHAPSKLMIRRKPAMNPSVYDDTNTRTHVTLIPKDKLYFRYALESPYANSGQSNDPRHDHENNVVFKSPTLPVEYKLFASTLITTDGLSIESWDKSHKVIGWPESGSKVELTSGPFATAGNNLQANVRITDDWYWDYVITAQFWILVPQGFTVSPYWGHI